MGSHHYLHVVAGGVKRISPYTLYCYRESVKRIVGFATTVMAVFVRSRRWGELMGIRILPSGTDCEPDGRTPRTDQVQRGLGLI